MIDDYKYMYLYKPLYILGMMLWIIDFFCVLGGWFYRY